MLSSTIYAEGFVGHRAQLERVENLIREGKLPHAVLFSGPEGIGKFTAARWVAAAFLCPEFGCGVCSSCRRVLKDLHPDVHAVRPEEGRRDILIRQVRKLSGEIVLKPFEAQGRVALLDDADRMNEEAQNAFLKTLEEPPGHTLVLLVSSAPDRLLATILSRCQRFRFSRLNQEDLQQFTARQAELALEFPESLGQGSPGRLLKLQKLDGARARCLFMDFLAAPKAPSPVKATADLMRWAEENTNIAQVKREKLRLSIDLGAGLLRDVATLLEGGETRHLLNHDLEKHLWDATRYYSLTSVFYTVRQMIEAAGDILGYVDPGLAVENIFRTMRDARKRG